MIDDSRNTQFDSTLGAYIGKTNIVNNVIFDNGGKGIHSYSSDNIIVANNTLHKNCQSNDIQDGEFTVYESSNITYANNIVFPATNIPPIANYNTTEIIVDFNLWAENQHLAEPFGTNTLTGNPGFVFPSSNPLEADFSLHSTSIAINAGSSTFAPTADIDGNSRVDLVDLGAYEFQPDLRTIEIKNTRFALYPNPAKEFLTVTFADNSNEPTEITIHNALGQKINTSHSIIDNPSVKINVTDLSNGIYFLSIVRNGKQIDTKKLHKN